jgi:hypothetical protein
LAALVSKVPALIVSVPPGSNSRSAPKVWTYPGLFILREYNLLLPVNPAVLMILSPALIIFIVEVPEVNVPPGVKFKSVPETPIKEIDPEETEKVPDAPIVILIPARA